MERRRRLFHPTGKQWRYSWLVAIRTPHQLKFRYLTQWRLKQFFVWGVAMANGGLDSSQGGTSKSLLHTPLTSSHCELCGQSEKWGPRLPLAPSRAATGLTQVTLHWGSVASHNNIVPCMVPEKSCRHLVSVKIFKPVKLARTELKLYS